MIDTKATMVDYTIASFKDFYTLDSSGIVLIIEINENRNIQNKEILSPRSALRSFKISTSMQKCVSNLTQV